MGFKSSNEDVIIRYVCNLNFVTLFWINIHDWLLKVIQKVMILYAWSLQL